MPKIITLSTGEEVHLKEKFTHKAETAYFTAKNQGVVDRETLAEGEGGQAELKVVRETPVVNQARAIEAALLIMVEKVKRGESETTPSQEWLDNLDENDYLTVSEAMLEIRRSGRERQTKSA